MWVIFSLCVCCFWFKDSPREISFSNSGCLFDTSRLQNSQINIGMKLFGDVSAMTDILLTDRKFPLYERNESSGVI